MLKDDDFRWERTVAWEILGSLIRVCIFGSLSTALPAVRIAFDSGSFLCKTFLEQSGNSSVIISSRGTEWVQN